jgi:hypothetical protein
MKFPDLLAVRHRSTVDEYGNPGKGALGAPEPVQGFLVTSEKLLLPPRAPVTRGDEVELDGRRFEVAQVEAARSPSKTVLQIATVKELPT